MNNVFESFKLECAKLLIDTGMVLPHQIVLAEPKANIPADLAFPTFVAARTAKTNPNELAQKLASSVKLIEGGLVGKVEALSAFVNFGIAPKPFAQAALTEVLAAGDDYGKSQLGQDQTLIVEFSSPNIARKMHVGHLRSTVIGNAIRNLLQAQGYKVIADNHLGDWGTQFGSLLAAYTMWGIPDELKDDPIEAFVQMYARYNNESKAQEGKDKSHTPLKDLARNWFLRLEQGDEQAQTIWKWMTELTLKEFAQTYKRLDVNFDTQHGESFYEPMLADLIQEALTKEVAKVEPDGAISVSFDDKLPSFLLRKKDGATLYQTRDIATCVYRWKNYQPTQNIYIVGQEQKLHFQQVFETVRRLGYPDIADRSKHISFGPVTDAQGERFSMRKGTAIFLDEVLDEAITRAQSVIAEKIAEGKTELTSDEQEIVSQSVGIGAVIYNDLYQAPERGIRFDWDKMLSFDGNSAPYIQYTHARCCSILRKAGEVTTNEHYDLLITPEEQAVVKQLARFPQILEKAGQELSPTLIADWTYTLAREFARFYHEHQVLEASTPELRIARLALVKAVAQGLRNGLRLLGIKAPERM